MLDHNFIYMLESWIINKLDIISISSLFYILILLCCIPVIQAVSDYFKSLGKE